VTAAEALAAATARLAAAGVETPRVDAELLVAHVLGTTRSEVARDRARELTAAEVDELETLVARRERREPLAYVLGEWGFRRLTLAVDPRVLVPRPETEVVVERCLERLDGLSEPRVLDVGTGSGAIALAIADEHPGAQVVGIDVSEEALTVARANAERSGLEVSFERGDLFERLPAGAWHLVVSNPPYVRAEGVDSLQEEVRDWEPRVALVAEGATDAIAARAREVLVPGGVLVLEVAEGDAERVATLLDELRYEDIRTTPDLTGRDRVVDGVTTPSD
jgi:release factor glutamine methyltransferase